ncbi:MAG: nucleotidyl transferase AbiEii/AbiGii toxin family protein [Gammaproteobacteria bacterium]
MIEKSEIILLATKLSLSPDTVEKDYVLSWLLWGINNHKYFSDTWVFKGGTSLKKCFFETFRFSEDLDFTLIETEHFSVDYLKNKFNEITESIYDETGIEFFKEQFKIKIIPKKDGKFSAQCNLHYNGPLRRRNSFASIKLDLTNDEVIISNPVKKRVHHPYSDNPTDYMWATCYSFEEVVAEKIRALGQRARPRDLYDVILFYRNKKIINNRQLIYLILEEKCNYKEIFVIRYTKFKYYKFSLSRKKISN